MKRKSFSRVMALACATVISSGLVLGGCAGKGGGEESAEAEAQKDNSILVETARPQKESIELDGSFMGTVESENEITVVAKISGDVTAAYFEEGDRVNAGDLLFTVDDRSAQISMAQAQASLESASASVSTASAGATVAELNLIYTQDQIKSTLGTSDTNRMQLENAVASAKYALKAAQENQELAREQFGLARDAYEDLEDALDDYEDSAEDLEKYAESLDKYYKNYNKLKNAGSNLSQVMTEMGLTEANLGLTPGASADDVADAYMRKNTKASTEYELGTMQKAAASSAESLRSARSSLDSNKDSMKLSMFQSAISIETAKNNVLSAEDAKRLAEKMLEDYDLYTMATILSGANAQLAGADSNLIAAQAGVIQAQAGVKQAQAGVEAAKLQLDYTQVTAPVSGVIKTKNVTVNNMAAQGAAAYVITPDEAANIVFYVAESVMRELTIGQDVTVERNGSTYNAVITENTGIADAASGLFKIKAQLISGAENLIAGTSVKLTLATQSADNVLTVPVDCVYYESQKAFVYCMEDGKAVKTQIETGITNNESVEVRSGISENSEIIVTWASQLKDGSEVKVKGSEKAQSENTTEGEAPKEGAVTTSSEEAEEAASIDGADLTDTERLNLSIANRIMQENDMQ